MHEPLAAPGSHLRTDELCSRLLSVTKATRHDLARLLIRNNNWEHNGGEWPVPSTNYAGNKEETS